MQNNKIFLGKVFLLSLFLFVFSCTTKNILTYDYQIDKHNIITLEIPDSLKENYSFDKVLYLGDKIYVKFITKHQSPNFLFIYEPNGKVYKILRIGLDYHIIDFQPLLNNEIAIIYEHENNYYYSKFNIEKSISIENKKIFTCKDYIYPRFDNNFLINKKIFFILINSQISKQQNRQKYPLFAYYNLEDDSVYYINIWYPDIKDNEYLSREYFYPTYNYISKNQYLISFNYTNKAYIYNSENNNVKEIYFKGSPLISNKIKPINNSLNTDNFFYFNHYIFSGIQTIEYNSNIYYIRYIKLKESEFDNEYIFTEIYNNKFEFTGFRVFNISKEQKTHFRQFINNNSYLLTNDSSKELFTSKIIFKEISKDSIIKTLNKLKKSSTNKLTCLQNSINEKDSINNIHIIKYFSNYISDSTYSILILNYNGCNQCFDYLFNFYKDNEDFFLSNKKKKLYLTILYDYDKDINKIKKLVINLKNDKIIIAKSSDYKDLVKISSIKTTLLLINKNNISFYKTYLPSENKDIIDKIISIYK